MILGLSVGFIIGLMLFVFICEYIDSTIGMGFGTILTPALLIAGYNPLQIVPVILISELFTGVLAGFMHHREGNVDFKLKSLDFYLISRRLKELGRIESIKRCISRHLRITLLLSLCSIIGTIAAVFLAVNLSKFWITLYIGVLVLAMGIVILICFNKKFKFSWSKIIGLGLLASFNKGISGGGYGPLVTGGQILAGVESKSAVGITSLAEGLTCAVGIGTYLLVSKQPLDLKLAPFIVFGAILAVPFSAKSVRKITEARLKLIIAVFTIILGLFTLIKLMK